MPESPLDCPWHCWFPSATTWIRGCPDSACRDLPGGELWRCDHRHPDQYAGPRPPRRPASTDIPCPTGRQGRPWHCAPGSCIGGVFSAIVLILFCVPLARVALKFSPRPTSVSRSSAVYRGLARRRQCDKGRHCRPDRLLIETIGLDPSPVFTVYFVLTFYTTGSRSFLR